VLRLLAERRVPFVPRGAGTGLSGGALAGSDAVLLTLTRLNRILRIDPADRRAVVAGCVNAQLSLAAAHSGCATSPILEPDRLHHRWQRRRGPAYACLKYGVTTNPSRRWR
jgi:glycolate oxidase